MIAAPLFLLAAGIGALTRAVTATALNDPRSVPWGTLSVNVIGCGVAGAASALSGPVATVLVTGGLGALTTFSTFVLEVIRLWRSGRRLSSVTYALATPIVCFAAAWASRTLVT
ncbi:MAG: putative fluoride ion transporter CrcB [Acidimicrobiales bacterium]|nr:MAG: putative fluoride ion transporter CrcB [Acidimicrobiales bacterium]